MKKIIAINAGPRKGWNTDQLIKSATKGAEDSGCNVEYVDLYKLEKYTGCISCFGCKQEKTYGKCVCHDGLYERLVFQVLTYNKEMPCCNQHKIPVVLIMTSNCAEEMYDEIGYSTILEQYKSTLDTFVGPTEVFVCGDTLQVKDYSKYNWTLFNPESKQKRYDDTFKEYLDKAYEFGKNI